MSVTLLMDEEKFALQGQDEPGVPVPYGEVATVEVSGRRYIALCDDAENAEVYELTGKPRDLRPVSFTTEEVELEIEDDEDDTEEDEESEDVE